MTAAIMPVRRDYRFHLADSRIHDWNPAGIHWTQFMNTLSIFFPAGERFFIESVRHYREQITDPELAQAVKAFIAQEAMHTREHVDYNKAMVEGGLPVVELERLVAVGLKNARRSLPKPVQLATTIALEHLTALLADIILRDPAFLKGADERYKSLWIWHAVEETEHKGVAYDVYEKVMGRGLAAYGLRVGTFVVANAIFWSVFYPYWFAMVKSSGKAGDLRGWMKAFRYQWGRPGGLRRILPGWLDYFRPGFHPWDHDNRAFLPQAEQLRPVVAGFAAVPS
jgi:predicted metal-dependent hydrolase